MTNTNKAGRKQLVFAYLDTSREQRLPLAKFLKEHKMIRRTFHTLEGEWKSEVKSVTKVETEKHQQELKNTVNDVWDRLEGKEPPKRVNGVEVTKVSEDEKLALARKVYADAMVKGASAKDKDLAVRMLGMLIDRQEVKIGLTADEIARRNLEAERQLKEGGYGDA